MVTNNFITGQELGEKLLASVQQMNGGLGKVVHSPVLAARQKSELSQAQFATLLGVSVRTLQEWEQGRRQPSRAAQTLLRVAMTYPNILRELVEG
jgi:putative transcriptional regulator